MHITLTVNYANGDEFEIEAHSEDLASVPAAVEAEIARIRRPTYTSLVIVLVPKG
jgi:hypothetical protein